MLIPLTAQLVLTKANGPAPSIAVRTVDFGSVFAETWQCFDDPCVPDGAAAALQEHEDRDLSALRDEDSPHPAEQGAAEAGGILFGTVDAAAMANPLSVMPGKDAVETAPLSVPVHSAIAVPTTQTETSLTLPKIADHSAFASSMDRFSAMAFTNLSGTSWPQSPASTGSSSLGEPAFVAASVPQSVPAPTDDPTAQEQQGVAQPTNLTFNAPDYGVAQPIIGRKDSALMLPVVGLAPASPDQSAIAPAKVSLEAERTAKPNMALAAVDTMAAARSGKDLVLPSSAIGAIAADATVAAESSADSKAPAATADGPILAPSLAAMSLDPPANPRAPALPAQLANATAVAETAAVVPQDRAWLSYPSRNTAITSEVPAPLPTTEGLSAQTDSALSQEMLGTAESLAAAGGLLPRDGPVIQPDPPSNQGSALLPQEGERSETARNFSDAASNFPRTAQTEPTSAGDPVKPVPLDLVRLVQSASDGPIKVILSPEELGALRFEVRQTEQGIHIHLAVDQPQTLELLRRQGDQLLADLRLSGFLDATLSFAGGTAQDSPARNGAALKDMVQFGPPENGENNSLPARRHIGSGLLDLRL